MSVSVTPGATLLTVIPGSPRVLASGRPRTLSAPLVIEYTICGVANHVTPEEMLMMRPPSRSNGSARWMMKNGARTLIANSRSNCSRVALSMVGSKAAMAVLLTRMSSGRPLSPSSRAANGVSTSLSTPSYARTANAAPPAVRGHRCGLPGK
jgi:hypothetical protein